MKINQIPNLRVEDFPSEQSWIGKLFVQINPFIQSINQILNGAIDFSTNIKSVTKSYTITSFAEFSFQWPYSDVSPVSLIVCSANKGSEQTPTILLAAWSFNINEKQITIHRLSEINTDSVSEVSGQYKFTIRASV